MNIKEFFLKKRIGSLLNIANTVLGIVCIVIYSIKANMVDEFSLQVVLFMLAATLCCAGYVLFYNKYTDIVNLAAVVLWTLAVGNLAFNSINTFADALNGITMFGSSGDIGYIVVLLVLMAVMLVAEMISCFLSGAKK